MTADRFEMELGVTTRGRIAGEGEIMSSELPACEAAYTLHEGPYEDLSAAYEAIEQWMRSNGAPGGGWAVGGVLEQPAGGAGPDEAEDGDVLAGCVRVVIRGW
ncbi:MAG TPA: GyrI-like domain-containing protein [Dehalococcoidia bacterium]|nr:GyrI-like domain-containing protein [Dehalococcoidia bacterium]